MEQKKRGGQPGNRNAPRAKHQRRAVSLSGKRLDRLYAELERRGIADPDTEQFNDFVYSLIDKGVAHKDLEG